MHRSSFRGARKQIAMPVARDHSNELQELKASLQAVQGAILKLSDPMSAKPTKVGIESHVMGISQRLDKVKDDIYRAVAASKGNIEELNQRLMLVAERLIQADNERKADVQQIQSEFEAVRIKLMDYANLVKNKEQEVLSIGNKNKKVLSELESARKEIASLAKANDVLLAQNEKQEKQIKALQDKMRGRNTNKMRQDVEKALELVKRRKYNIIRNADNDMTAIEVV